MAQNQMKEGDGIGENDGAIKNLSKYYMSA